MDEIGESPLYHFPRPKRSLKSSQVTTTPNVNKMGVNCDDYDRIATELCPVTQLSHLSIT
jgi:hypothetical protein